MVCYCSIKHVRGRGKGGREWWLIFGYIRSIAGNRALTGHRRSALHCLMLSWFAAVITCTCTCSILLDKQYPLFKGAVINSLSTLHVDPPFNLIYAIYQIIIFFRGPSRNPLNCLQLIPSDAVYTIP